MARPAQTHQSTQNSQQNGAKGNEKCEFLKANIGFFFKSKNTWRTVYLERGYWKMREADIPNWQISAKNVYC
jgi:hypothetical protein